ncbi:type II secretion system protein GspL [Geomesophilobacter sediminis]|uniref:General secretion pathway protein GspL n=1 Tax=Geomesophilobacter sediminis TaxID=2798584 RepID=A0A8J7M0Z4_9BACT|nr:type II secretion system protein GspL [Geomesophilobacter sediminis]MBJ6726635.1 general secretion pathway protein GspL [Geomesophilobacter sediminis]
MDLLVIQLKKDEAILATFRRKRATVGFLGAERHSFASETELDEILRRQPVQERRVILLLPPEQLFLREVELPISDRDKVRELLPMELRGETLLDTDALVFDALPIADGKFLAVWGKNKELSDVIDRLAAAGLEPEVVTASLFHWDKLAPAAGTCVVTDGEAVAAYRDRTPLFFRPLRADGGAAELERTVAAIEIAKGITVENVLRYAPDAEERVLPTSEVSEAFGDDLHAIVALAGAYATAAAVADGSAVNLRRGPLAYTAGTAKFYKQLRVPALLAACLVLLAFGEVGVRYYLVQKDLTSLDNTVKGIYREVFPTRKNAVDEVAEIKGEIKKLEGAKATSNTMQLLKDLADAKGDDVTGFYETEIDGTEVRLKGDARTMQAANDFKTRAAKLFDSGEVSQVQSRPDGSVTFSYRGKLKGVTR